MAQKCGGLPAPFLTKTYDIVDDEMTNDVISWGPKGTSFVVWKPVEFARDLLPLHFKHSNFSSFVRQLNTYGFRKVMPDRWEFGNENFRQGEQRLLSQVRRRKTVLQIPTSKNTNNINAGHFPSSSNLNSTELMHSSSPTSSPQLAPMPQSPFVSDFLTELINENEMLRKDNQSLKDEIGRAKRHYDELLGFLSNFVDVSKLDFDNLVQGNATICIKEHDGDQTVKKKREEVVDESIEKQKGLKIFGVLMKGSEGEECANNVSTKRRRCEDHQDINGERPAKMSFGLPWIGIHTSKVTR